MAAPLRVKAVYEYTSPHEDDLNFTIGQVITVTDQDDAEWYGGEYVDDAGEKHEGIFPRNFVEKFEPTAPPRPTRTRTKRDSVPSGSVESTEPPPAAEPAPVPAPAPRQPDVPQTDPEPQVEEPDEPLHKSPESIASPPAPAQEPAAAPAPRDPIASPPAIPKASEPVAPVAAEPAPAPKPKPKGPPPVSEKPTSNSFRDRIAAFNKPAAPPVAPFKPGSVGGSGSSGGAGFIKKPFVAAPPSRNAYIPPPQQAPTAKVYRRDEDPEVKAAETQVQEQAERAGFVSPDANDADEEDQPKPTSLKERIALLQKQQMEQAQRLADSAAKKEKPKKPAKKPSEPTPAADDELETDAPAPLERQQTEESPARSSMEAPAARAPPPARRKSSVRPSTELVRDGNEADMSGAGDTTEGHDDTTEREDSEEISRRASRAPTGQLSTADSHKEEPNVVAEEEVEEDEEEDEEEEVDPEVRRKEELRARMAKMSGGMGFHGMFGAPMPGPPAPAPKKKKPKAEPTPEEEEEATASRAAPPVPTAMALPGLGGPRKSMDSTEVEGAAPPAARAPPPPMPARQTEEPTEVQDDSDEEEDNDLTPAPTAPGPALPHRSVPQPPAPASRPAPPPVPSESRPPPPAPAAVAPESPTDGSESDDELSGAAHERGAESTAAESIKSPPPLPPTSPPTEIRSPPLSPRLESASTSTAEKRASRPPPPIPGIAPPIPSQSRPPPPPPPGSISRQNTSEVPVTTPTRPPQAGEENEDEASEYEGDYDTDIASSAPHKDALKSHARESSLEDNTLQSPIAGVPPPSLPPPVPMASPPARAAPPPIPSQPPPENKRRSVDAPRAAPPPPPPPAKEPLAAQEEYDPYNYAPPSAGVPTPGHAHKTPRIEEEAYFPTVQSPGARAPPPAAPAGRSRQSMDVPRSSMAAKRSMEAPRPSMSVESGFIANDLDLSVQSGWWKQSNQVPPSLQGRRDIFYESAETTTNNQGAKTVITREISVLFQDYSQTVITVRYDPYDPSDVELDQRHEPPPRPLRQDQMEEYYERFGRHISENVTAKKDSVVGDGSPQGLVYELLRPYRDVLLPVGTRAYGALVYANMANASTQQFDAIRPGDIMSIRNAKFQGKHGAMHAKYSAEVGKPDHVAIVSEWDGSKKKVRAWEQGRESKKVKVESFKLDDLRSGEVKIWRVMPRSWVGWSPQP